MNYTKNRNQLVAKQQEEHGYTFCEHCNKSTAFNFQCHHIYFRSEKPNHPMLHHKDNLIILCDVCHSDFHGTKSIRNYLIEERKLNELFKN